MPTSINVPNSPSVGIIAGANLSGMRYRVATSNGGLGFVANETTMPMGILQDDPIQGKHASVISHGYSYALLGATVAENDFLGAMADGKHQPLADGQVSVAVALDDGVAGDIIPVRLALGGGSSTTPSVVTPPVADDPAQISLPAHGFNLTNTEGDRVPVGVFYDGTNWSVPTAFNEVTHFAVDAPDADTLSVRTLADMQGREYLTVSNALGGLGEFAYFDVANGQHTLTQTDMQLYQVDQRSATRIKFDVELAPASGGTGTGVDTRRVLRVAEFDILQDIASGTVLNLNADTPTFTSLRTATSPYTSHSWPTSSPAFESGYYGDYWIEWAGQTVTADELDAGPTAAQVTYVGPNIATAGGVLRVYSYINETV